MGSSKKGGDQKQQVADYHMSIHAGVCWGPVTAVKKILIGEKKVFDGNETTNSIIGINKLDLFGGPEKEGGVAGSCQLLLGGQTQTIPEILAAKLGLTTATTPGFRGLTSVFFYGGKGRPGFYWATNQPYIKPQWITVFRKSPGMSTLKQFMPCDVTVPDDDDEETDDADYVVDDSNPANIIYECLTNTDWGMGAPDAALDMASFESCQDVLFTETFGMSMMWAQQATIEAFVTEVLDHINATLFVNPRTGLLTLKLIRFDYDPDTLKIITPNNADLSSFSRKLWGETINEIVVTWTNPVNEEEETVISQDLGNISMQGGIVSDSRNYYGVRNRTLAKKLADREVRVSSSPQVSADAELDRRFWDALPGDCVKLSWPNQGVIELIMRVMKVDYGKPGDSKVKVSLLEDVFSFQQGAFVAPPSTEWKNLAREPAEFTFVKFLSLPYLILESELGTAVAEGIVYPESSVAILASFDNDDTNGFAVLAEGPLPNGDLEYSQQNSLRPVGTAQLAALLPFAVSSDNIFLNAIKGPDTPTVGGFMLIGDVATPEDECEIALIMSGDTLTGWDLRRGVMDTIPRAWPSGTRVWFFALDDPLTENVIRPAGATVNYKLLPRTSLGSLTEAAATVRPYLVNDRPWLPTRPANVIVDGSSNAEVVRSATFVTLPVSWVNRNRLEESAPLQKWDDPTITGEVGQTTTIRITSQFDGTLITDITGLTGTSHAIPKAAFAEYPRVRVTILAVRDGYESFQNHGVDVTFTELLGYGNSYGYNYGSA